MFKTTKEIGKRYAVKLEDGEYLSQGNSAVKLFRKRSRAEDALEEHYAMGEVVEVSVAEVVTSKVLENIDASELHRLLTNLVSSIDNSYSVDLYQAYTQSFGGANVVRHTPIGEPRVHEPGDNYQDVELHLQLRINT